ncbi:unnamed protein product [Triticum turgidum subsp. durum]|uniref:Uncharacterized protein n=1 Tax=Triticum turgidum subsp. durum TaxID=4567 RepID=A0A9R0R263_TRITD|nr:unnamed protein product [Triticum turgidum subsp. durum]
MMCLFISLVFWTRVLWWLLVLFAGIFLLLSYPYTISKHMLVPFVDTCIFPRRSWNSSASDNKLWRMNYSLFFSTSHLRSNSTLVSSGVQNSHGILPQNNVDPVFDDPNLNWKEVFHKKHAEHISWNAASNRAICQQCRSVLWLSNLTCAAPHHCPKKGKDEIKLTPLLPYAVSASILWSILCMMGFCMQ